MNALRTQAKNIPIFAPLKKPVVGIMQKLDLLNMNKLDPQNERRKMFDRHSTESVRPGDILHVEGVGTNFNGVLLAIKRRGSDTSFVLRNRILGQGIEMRYNLFNPAIKTIRLITRKQKRARRAKLFYMRESKHDVGNIDNIVRQKLKKNT